MDPDSITADEARAVQFLSRAAREALPLADRLSEMVWIQDGITADEALAVEYLRWAARGSPSLADRLLEMVWI